MDQFLFFLLRGVQVSAPVAFAAIGAVFSEKGGVINIGLEGIMLTTTFFVVWGSLTFGSFFVGVICALVAGVAMASIHALVTVTFKVNQIISGVSLNILALGLTRFLSQRIYGQETQTPINSEIYTRVLGVNVWAWLVIPMAGLAWYVLYRTPFGLRLRAVGENPEAADTLGINVTAYRYAGVLISGLLVGFSGATLFPTQWLSGMTGGRGFLALAAMIFGRWNPIGAAGAGFLFGYAETFRIVYEDAIPIPSQFVQMLPFVLAIVVLAGIVGKARGPAAAGIPYRKAG